VSDPNRVDESLSAELGALRSALLEARAPDDELALLAAARARAVIRGPSAVRPSILAAARARVARARRPLAVAAAAIAAVVALAVLGLLRPERDEGAAQSERVAASLHAPSAAAATPAIGAPEVRLAFRPISFSRGLSTAESYSVVRVRLELATIAPGGAPSGAIEADLLVGEDGLARAIRFDSADTLPVYAAFGPTSGERR
jgi:hypothetical protein